MQGEITQFQLSSLVYPLSPETLDEEGSFVVVFLPMCVFVISDEN